MSAQDAEKLLCTAGVPALVLQKEALVKSLGLPLSWSADTVCRAHVWARHVIALSINLPLAAIDHAALLSLSAHLLQAVLQKLPVPAPTPASH